MAQESNETLLLDPAEVAIDKHVLIESMATWLQANGGNPLLLLDVEPNPGERVGIAGIFQGYDATNSTIELDGTILASIPPDFRWNYRIPWDVLLESPHPEHEIRFEDFWESTRIISLNEFLWNVSDAVTGSGWLNPSHAWPRDFITDNDFRTSSVYDDQQHFKCVSVVFSELHEQITTAQAVYGSNNVPIGDINCCGGGNG